MRSKLHTPNGVRQASAAQVGRSELMAKRKPRKRDIENYAHTDKERVNNPPVGLVTPETDKDAARKTYQYDPHIDPQLS